MGTSEVNGPLCVDIKLPIASEQVATSFWANPKSVAATMPFRSSPLVPIGSMRAEDFFCDAGRVANEVAASWGHSSLRSKRLRTEKGLFPTRQGWWA